MPDETPTLILMMGLPRSGKTTKVAKISSSLVHDHQMPAVVNPDAIRLSLHGHAYIPEAEGFVWATAKVMVRALFMAGHTHVIVDATNTSRKRRDFWQPVMGTDNWLVQVCLVPTPYETCLERAGDDEAMREVIERMAEGWECVQANEIVSAWRGTSPDWLQLWGPEVPTPGHCKRCGFSYGEDASKGCAPGNCSFRPDEGTASREAMRRRDAEMAIRGITA